MSKKKKIGIAFLIVLVILLLVTGVLYFTVRRYYHSTNYMSDEEVKEMIEQQIAANKNPNNSNDNKDDANGNQNASDENSNGDQEEIDEELKEIQDKMEKYASSEPITTDGNVYNVLLIGLDKTEKSFLGNSDSMILISVNYKLKTISMVSLLRDTHVYIPNIGYRKLNAAHANGGGPLLIETIEYNYKIDIDRYVTVDFKNMIEIIDEIGKIELTFTDAEAKNANNMIKQQCKIMGLKSKDYLLTSGGTYQCGGMWAVAYARIRKVGNADYQRTERQREVLMKLLDKVKELDLGEIDKLVTRLMPMLTHNIPESEFWGLLSKLPTFLQYEIAQDRVPYNGYFTELKNGNLAPNWEVTVKKLKTTLYGEDFTESDDTNEKLPDQITDQEEESSQQKEPEFVAGEEKLYLDSPYEPKIFTIRVNPLNGIQEKKPYENLLDEANKKIKMKE